MNGKQQKFNTKRDLIIKKLKEVFDPELPINVWDLGLIYGINLKPDNSLVIVYTLTSPNCPAAEIIPADIKAKLLELSFIQKVTLELIWEPKWSPAVIPEEIRIELGLL